MMQRHGEVFADRYHAHALRSPTEAARAIAYVLGNFFIHAARRGEACVRGIDPFCSAASQPGASPLAAAPETWLLRIGWTRARPP